MKLRRTIAARSRQIGLAVLVAWTGVAASPPAGEVSYDALRIEAVRPVSTEDNPAAGRWTIFLDGYIDPQASIRLGALIAQQNITSADVYFNSPGGSLIEGMAIGRLLRQRGYTTHVGRHTADIHELTGGVCYSACPFAYAGGAQRDLQFDSVLGVHRAENRVPVSDEVTFEKLVSAQASQYLIAMGVSPELYTIMSQVPHEVIWILPRAEAERLVLVNE